MLAVLEERREKIATGLEDIEKARQEVEFLKNKYEESQARIEEESRQKIQDAVDEGRRLAQELREKTREEAAETLTKAKQNIELEIRKARIELRETMVNLSFQAAEKILQQEVDKKGQQSMVDDLIRRLEQEMNPGSQG